MIRNTYLDIAGNDLQYLESVLATGSKIGRASCRERVLKSV